jgi:hypothetical protein
MPSALKASHRRLLEGHGAAPGNLALERVSSFLNNKAAKKAMKILPLHIV